ncbi:hypothetical protein SAMN02745121_08621 [Nannocystis exedens]|uniref:Uncharacterized protein n=1 Tax=Nannocystis exedens TaxID=54 RepID=A0A1I2IF24_9BACT|nr:hypothetical protein [Nannocystis exedens]PCC68216.1 hypothetical protein NAEX_01226 [Nannocystis exedens]SFF40220.1 hypothetical protein SAMN02745121_08621 [Nannocystis exedens]
MTLHLALVLSMLAPPSEEAARAAFNAGELERALELYLERAKDPDVHPPDALAGAHDCLRALHRETQDIEHLCRALDLARTVRARDVFVDDDERAFWAELEAQDAALAGDACPASPLPDATPEDSQSGTKASGEDVSVTAAIDGESVAAPENKTEGPAPLPVLKDSPRPRRPQGRLIGGSVLSAVGVGLLGGMAGALANRERADATIATITANAIAEDRDFTPAERAAVHEADRRYTRLDATWPALLAAGSVSLITGLAVMLAPNRQASRIRARAGGAGLVYSF